MDGRRSAPPEEDDTSDDTCGICALRGVLVCCDAPGCAKVYHTTCLGLCAQLPETWFCPCHFCCLCGVPDVSIAAARSGAPAAADAVKLTLCTYCITAYCPAHRPDTGHFHAARAALAVPPVPSGALAALFPVSSATLASDAAHAASTRPPAASSTTGAATAAAAREGVAPSTGDAPRPASTTGRPKKRARRSEVAKLQEVQASFIMRGSAAAATGAGEDSGAEEEPVAGRKRGRATAVSLNAGAVWPRSQPATAMTGAPTAAAGGADASFRCAHCLVPTSRVQFARALERVWSKVVNDKLAKMVPPLLGTLSDSNLLPLYAACGHVPASLGVDAAALTTACGGAPAVDAPPDAAWDALVRACGDMDAAQLRNVLTVEATEAAVIPSIPACVMDILARIRSCTYTSIAGLTRDLHELQKVVEGVTGTDVGATAASMPYFMHVTTQTAGQVSETRVVQAGVQPALTADAIAHSGNTPSGASRHAVYLDYVRTFVQVFSSAVDMRAQKARLQELEDRMRHIPSRNHAVPSPQGRAFQRASGALAVLCEDARVTPEEALVRVYRARQTALYPALSWTKTPYTLPHVSLESVCATLREGVMARAKADAVRALELRTQRLVAASRKPILTGFGPNSTRWSTSEMALLDMEVEEDAASDASPARVLIAASSARDFFPAAARAMVPEDVVSMEVHVALWARAQAPSDSDSDGSEAEDAAVNAALQRIAQTAPAPAAPRAAALAGGANVALSVLQSLKPTAGGPNPSPTATTMRGRGRASAAAGSTSDAPRARAHVHIPSSAEAQRWMDVSATVVSALQEAPASAGSSVTARSDATDLVTLVRNRVRPAGVKRAAEGARAPSASPAGTPSDVMLLMGMLASQQAQIASQGEALRALAASVENLASRLDATASSHATSPRGISTSIHTLTSSLDAPVDAAARARALFLRPEERTAAMMLTEFAAMDVDGDVTRLEQLLPPSQAEVTHWMDDLSVHLRGSLIATAELKAAWIASRRALMSIPAPVGVEARLVAPAHAAGVAPDATGGAGGDVSAHADEASGDEDTEAIITLGEGRLAMELSVANSSLMARVRQLELQLAARDASKATAGAAASSVASVATSAAVAEDVDMA